jgi:hypothetical protein
VGCRLHVKVDMAPDYVARHIMCVSSACTDLCGVVSRTRSSERDAVSEMKEDPSEPACGSRLQTAVSRCRPMAVVVNVTEKA